MRSRLLLWLPLFALLPALALATGQGAAPSDKPVETGAVPQHTPEQLLDIYGDNLAKLDENGRPIHPMMLEINSLLESESIQMVKLQTRFENAKNQDEADYVQTLMAELKEGTETQILQVQLRFAKSSGNLELAEKIESALKFKENPVVPTAKISRPVPTDQPQRR